MSTIFYASTEDTKTVFHSWFVAMFGGGWATMSREHKRLEWDSSMHLRGAIGNRVWSNPYNQQEASK